MNKFLKIFRLAAVLVSTTVAVSSCEKDETGPKFHHNGGRGK